MRQAKYLLSEDSLALKRHIFYQTVLNPKFQKEMGRIRKQWKIDPMVNQSEDRGLTIHNHNLVRNPRLKKDILSLIKKFGINEEWGYILPSYIIYNYAGDRLIEIIEKPHLVKTKNEFFIRVYPTTTKEEIKFLFDQFREEMLKDESLPRRRRPAPCMVRDSRIYQLHEQGLTTVEIYRIIQKEFGVKLDFGNIERIISDFPRKFKF